jgi:hypothetical protein
MNSMLNISAFLLGDNKWIKSDRLDMLKDFYKYISKSLQLIITCRPINLWVHKNWYISCGYNMIKSMTMTCKNPWFMLLRSVRVL